MQSTEARGMGHHPLPLLAKSAPCNQDELRPIESDAPNLQSPATSIEPTPYDEIPYSNSSHRSSHPRTLEAIATLFGMRPAPLPQSRILELGCASGWNLLPIAVDYPESMCRGIDLSEKQISQGQSMIQSMKLKNIELSQTNIMDIDASWGEYDYIVCHGIFSWVPQEVRAKIMAICKENLAPQGVAYISYNVLPGWHQRGTIRDMMLYHANQVNDPNEKITRAREVIEFMAENCIKDTPYANMLQEELAMIRKAKDAYLFHDHLEAQNHPLYFHQFTQQASDAALQYLGDVSFASMLPNSVGKKASAAITGAPLEKQEQYMDFLRNRMFRCSLLCHADVPLNRSLQPSHMHPFYLSLKSRPKPDAIESFQDGTTRLTLDKGSMATNTKLGRAAIESLVSAWPCATTVNQIYASYLEKGGDASSSQNKEESLHAIASGLMDVFASGLLDISVHPPRVVNAISDRPVVSPWLRRLAEQGLDITDQHHAASTLDDFGRFIAQRLDGRHNQKMLIESVLMAIDDGRITIKLNGQTEGKALEEEVPRMVDLALHYFCNHALLIA